MAEKKAVQQTVTSGELDAKCLLQELQVQQMELERQNEELRRVQLELEVSQARYQRITEKLTDYLYTVLIENGRVVETIQSPACERITGYTPEEFAANTYLWIQMITPEDRNQVRNLVQQILTGVDIPSFEHRIIRKDGEIRWVNHTIIQFFDASGNLLAYEGVIQDITERKRAEQLLAENEKHYRMLFQSMQNGFALHEILLDAHGKPIDYRFLEVNPAFERLTGLRGADIAGRTVLEVLPGIENFWIETYGKVALTGESAFFEHYSSVIQKYYEVAAYSPRSGFFATIISDITERKQFQEALQKQVIALTQPLDNPAGIAFADLFNVEEIQRIQDTFAQATGVASIITTTDGVPLTAPSNFCRLCSEIIRKTDKGLTNCLKSDAVLGRYHPSGPVIQHCLSGGLWDAGASISVGGRHIANWLIGQVRNEEQDETAMVRYADEIGVDPEIFKAALSEVPVMSKEKFEKIAMALYSFATELSLKAYQNVQQARFMTELNEANEALRETSKRLEFALAGTNDGIWDVNMETGDVYISPRGCNILNYQPEQFSDVMTHWSQLVHPEDIPSTMAALEAYIDGLEPLFMVEQRLKTASGTWKWILTRGKAVSHGPDGRPLRMVGTHTDITQRKQYEQELVDKNAELESFTYTVSHDLKSPLITIQSYAGQILHDMETGRHNRIKGDLKRIKGAAAKMTMLLDDLLELSRVGRMMNLPSNIDMGRLVKDVLAQLAGLIGQHKVTVVVRPDLPEVHGDRRRIAMALQNLVENAIKYRGDQNAPRIEIGARKDDKECVFFVSDNGCGIAPRYHESIFGLFNKLNASSDGTGIGLALVKRIIEVHDGRVWVESEGVNAGSTFCFTLSQWHE